MRQAILDFIASLDLGTYKVTQNLPWDESGTPLYLNNLKTIYVGVAQSETETIYTALNGLNIQNEIITIPVAFASDAKLLPSNYVLLISQLSKVNNIEQIDSKWNRKFVQTTDYEGDKLVTQVDYIFTKLLR